VGGPGQEFLAAGKNWNIVTRGLKPENLAMMGQWRVEVRPGAPRQEDVFLHVIQVGDQSLDTMDATELVQADKAVGVRLRSGRETWEVVFHTSGELGGRIHHTGDRSAIDRELTTTIEAQRGIMANDQ